MKLISHRGNINGKFESWENEPTYVDLAISKGYDVEIDIWYKDNVLWLGHDEPQYGINIEWLIDRTSKLWIHCKNIESIQYFKNCGHDFNYFWHQTDTLTLTSKGHMWVYPGKQPIKDSVAVMPEINGDDVSECYAICSDIIEKYRKDFTK